MVAISEVRGQLPNIKNLGSGLVAVFVGGTSGIGLSTAREFTRYATAPHIYLIGRNEAQASEIISELRAVNQSATVDFIKSDVSLLKNVDTTCREIAQKESKVNLLFLSAGILTTQGRTETTEGLDRKLSLHYYARMRFADNLLPLLNQAASSDRLARVVSVFSPGNEGKLIEDDLDLRSNYSLSNAAAHGCTMTSLFMAQLAAAHPNISWVHSRPGAVNTNVTRDFNPLVRGLTNALFMLTPLLSSIGLISVKESGERHAYAATSPLFAPRVKGVDTVGADGAKGSGAYRVDYDSSIVKAKSELVKGYLGSGVGKKVWEHTREIYAKATVN
ncbi:short-chain dehydrogenases/reductase [Aspergillus eucalypticola CBS 122712]|uniref:Short-chain dehydrogenases/reductase n=1 Tax=Aspergillus eucalypticola (strain CBS 122712 / IBT 29274) TaxID=1448314 RepID=A0A317VJP6_ASPEC|nr:short-chain dehydrogenases/reductase [Aspergillus eucalypticola CBS 122712]PWY74135.1 short-chain dehydrogenases/reductase [Aspergillus eucalypticola CBS 122712]